MREEIREEGCGGLGLGRGRISSEQRGTGMEGRGVWVGD